MEMRRIATVCLTFGCMGLVLHNCVQAQERLEYNRDVRPILADTCFKCHGPDSAARKADLRLDKREAAIDMGALAPGKPEESSLIERVFSTDPETVMPPPAAHKVLTEEQKETLRRWVQEGSEYQPHWSFIAPVRPEVPATAVDPWVRNPIDAFILAKLQEKGLKPNPEADRRTLARRASFDVTGLPPSPELVEKFVNDPAPNAYEKYVDELLQSPHWGEHRGRYWLDYARYADTHGIHFDNFREMWSYRDWVIEAFNKNMPYDEFTIESLGGDLLPNRSLDQQIGSGFNRCNMTTNEGGIIDEEYLVLYARDRTETTVQVWMGLTAGCATCHDHKFDPLSQKEFYQLAAFFNNTTQGARDGNIKDTPPIIAVPMEEDEARWQSLQALLPEARKQVEDRKQSARPVFEEWAATAAPDVFGNSIPTQDLHLHVPFSESEGTTAKATLNGEDRDLTLIEGVARTDGTLAGKAVEISKSGVAELADAGNFEFSQPFSCSAWIKMPANDGGGSICARMDDQNGFRGWDFWIEGRRVGAHIINVWQDDALKVVSKEQIPANEWVHVAFTYDGSAKASGVKVFINGAEQTTNVQADALKSTTLTGVPFKIGQRHTSGIISGLALQDLRIYSRKLEPADVSSLGKSSVFRAILEKPSAERTEKELNDLFAWWLPSKDEAYQSLTAEVAKLEQEESTIRSRGTIAHVMQEKDQAAMAYVLFRGDYDKRRDEVQANTPEILPPFPADAPRNRLGFAKWLLLPEHPLMARVTVNRYWQEIFGTGIVKTTGDFGVSGELPVNPQLLDWLAVEFRQTGWDVKRLFKLILTSATYRQSPMVSPEKREIDPENRLLSRGSRYRMDAEMIRDAALAASGLLVPRLGGPSVKPYQPEGVWEAIAMDVSNTKAYQQDKGEGLYRRSLYTFWKRMAPPASMDIFNAPNREFCVVRRERTNTPLQALVTLNDVQFIEAARLLATAALKQQAEVDSRLQFIASRLLTRPFRDEELAVVRQSLAGLKAYYEGHADEAGKVVRVGETAVDESVPSHELAAWTMLANELMNLDEVLCK